MYVIHGKATFMTAFMDGVSPTSNTYSMYYTVSLTFEPCQSLETGRRNHIPKVQQRLLHDTRQRFVEMDMEQGSFKLQVQALMERQLGVIQYTQSSSFRFLQPVTEKIKDSVNQTILSHTLSSVLQYLYISFSQLSFQLDFIKEK